MAEESTNQCCCQCEAFIPNYGYTTNLGRMCVHCAAEYFKKDAEIWQAEAKQFEFMCECTECGHLFDSEDKRADFGPIDQSDGLPTHSYCPACAMEIYSDLPYDLVKAREIAKKAKEIADGLPTNPDTLACIKAKRKEQ